MKVDGGVRVTVYGLNEGDVWKRWWRSRGGFICWWKEAIWGLSSDWDDEGFGWVASSRSAKWGFRWSDLRFSWGWIAVEMRVCEMTVVNENGEEDGGWCWLREKNGFRGHWEETVLFFNFFFFLWENGEKVGEVRVVVKRRRGNFREWEDGEVAADRVLWDIWESEWGEWEMEGFLCCWGSESVREIFSQRFPVIMHTPSFYPFLFCFIQYVLRNESGRVECEWELSGVRCLADRWECFPWIPPFLLFLFFVFYVSKVKRIQWT